MVGWRDLLKINNKNDENNENILIFNILKIRRQFFVIPEVYSIRRIMQQEQNRVFVHFFRIVFSEYVPRHPSFGHSNSLVVLMKQKK